MYIYIYIHYLFICAHIIFTNVKASKHSNIYIQAYQHIYTYVYIHMSTNIYIYFCRALGFFRTAMKQNWLTGRLQ